MSAYRIYLIFAGGTALFFSLFFTVSQIYRIEVAGLNPLQLVLVGTVLEAACFLFEIPTGVVADIYSRKLSVIIGLILIGGGFLLEGSFPIYIAILASQVLWGVGHTFLSGANEAWIADEVGERELDRLFLKGAQIGQVFSLIGILLSTAVGAVMINLPMLVSGFLFIMLALFLMAFMPETKFTPMPKNERNTWSNMIKTFSEGIYSIKEKSILIVILFITLLHGLFSEGIDRLWNAHFIENIKFPTAVNLKPVIWFGIINAVAMILSIIVVEFIKRKMNKTGRLEKVWLLLGINGVLVGAIIIFGLAGNFAFGFATYLTLYIMRTTNGPLYRAWLNQNIKAKVRATVLSTYGQIDAFGQIIGGPIIGYIAVKYSISVAIVIAGIILSPVILLYLFSAKQTKRVTTEEVSS
ncbi:MAG: MFS transporter [Firmicutes bacterium]|nr:MFS transporter [Bacillota bacterium]